MVKFNYWEFLNNTDISNINKLFKKVCYTKVHKSRINGVALDNKKKFIISIG